MLVFPFLEPPINDVPLCSEIHMAKVFFDGDFWQNQTGRNKNTQKTIEALFLRYTEEDLFGMISVFYSRRPHNSLFNRSLTADLMAALLEGYMLARTNSSSPSKCASGSRTVTSFNGVSPRSYMLWNNIFDAHDTKALTC